VDKDMWVKDIFCKKKFWIYGCFKFLYSQTFFLYVYFLQKSAIYLKIVAEFVPERQSQFL